MLLAAGRLHSGTPASAELLLTFPRGASSEGSGGWEAKALTVCPRLYFPDM
ncbi:hypothetical protein I79_016031 [Cricetulus griseus]|uniref:Uncharacterized protein n=1 Tax=Cricetulus griseus TaxID=10029 RepID=G3HYA7_CRIGR|nr:hypothetical protein I79_016031 [Cricetulus griseus]